MPEPTSREAVVREFCVSRETLARLDAIIETLDSWRGRVNLIGPCEWPVIWWRHVADSLQLVPLLEDAERIVDLGSGAGFPGLVVAAALSGRSRVTLVESTGKKCAFLRGAGEAAGLDLDVRQGRIENLMPFPVDAITARALAPLPRLLKLAEMWTSNGAFCVFPKGESAEEELTAARKGWNFQLESVASRTARNARILKLSKVKRHDT